MSRSNDMVCRRKSEHLVYDASADCWGNILFSCLWFSCLFNDGYTRVALLVCQVHVLNREACTKNRCLPSSAPNHAQKPRGTKIGVRDVLSATRALSRRVSHGL